MAWLKTNMLEKKTDLHFLSSLWYLREYISILPGDVFGKSSESMNSSCQERAHAVLDRRLEGEAMIHGSPWVFQWRFFLTGLRITNTGESSVRNHRTLRQSRGVSGTYYGRLGRQLDCLEASNSQMYVKCQNSWSDLFWAKVNSKRVVVEVWVSRFE